jgi:hypothetical protein
MSHYVISSFVFWVLDIDPVLLWSDHYLTIHHKGERFLVLDSPVKPGNDKIVWVYVFA